MALDENTESTCLLIIARGAMRGKLLCRNGSASRWADVPYHSKSAHAAARCGTTTSP